jgi:hypothetical protein
MISLLEKQFEKMRRVKPQWGRSSIGLRMPDEVGGQ